MLFIFIFIYPNSTLYIKTTLSILSTFAYNTFEFWDSFIVLALLLFEFILWIIAAYKRFKRVHSYVKKSI